MKRSAGMTLLAFMLALSLGALLLLLAVELLVVSYRSLRWQAATVQLERAGDRALRLLGDELRAAGFRAGARSAPLPPAAPGCGAGDGWALALSPAIAFADRGGSDALTLSDGAFPRCLPTASLQQRSDLLALRRTAFLPSADRAGARRLRDTQWYLMVDARGAGRFAYLGRNAGASDLGAGGDPAWEWRVSIFFVRSYSVTRGDGVPALCVERLLGARMRSQCLVEGVARMHVEFAIDDDGDGMSDRVLAALRQEELRTATRATVYVHVRTLEALRVRREARVLQLGGETVHIPPGDPYLHRVFVRSVSLDNWS